jgi:hypothetical protein
MEIDNDFFELHDNMIKRILNDKKKSGKFKLNKKNVEKFILGQCSNIRRQAAKDLIDTTIYLSFDDIFKKIEERVDELNKQLNTSEKKIAMYVGDNTKSGYFISHIAFYFIKKKYPNLIPYIFIKSFSQEMLLEDHNIIIFDDVSYSGSQISTTMNTIYYDICIIKKRPPPSIYICLLATSKTSYQKLSKVPTKKIGRRGIFDDYIQSPFKIISGEVLPSLYDKLGLDRTFYLFIFFSPFLLTSLKPVISLYMDIKIADSLSTFKFALQYGPIIPSNYIKDNIDILEIVDISINDNDYELIHDFNSQKPSFKNKGEISDHIYKLIKDLLNEEIDKEIDHPIYLPLITNCQENVNAKLKKYKKFFNNYMYCTVPDKWINHDSGLSIDRDSFETMIQSKGFDFDEYKKFTKEISDVNTICPQPLYKSDKYTKKIKLSRSHNSSKSRSHNSSKSRSRSHNSKSRNRGINIKKFLPEKYKNNLGYIKNNKPLSVKYNFVK